MKNISKFIAPIIVFSIFIIPIFAYSATFKSQDQLKVSESETQTENTYLLTRESEIGGSFDKDLFIISGRTIFNGQVKGDLTIIGGEVDVAGQVDGDVRIIGGEAKINGKLSGDVVVIGGKIEIDKAAELNTQSFFIGGETDFRANSQHPVKIISAKTNLNGSINSPVEVTTQELVIGSMAKLEQGIVYYAPKKATELSGSQISGQVNFNQISPIKDTNFIKRAVINFVSFWLILKFVSTLLIAFILAYIFRVFTRKVIDLSSNSFGKSLLLGLLSIILIPVVIIMLLASLIGLPLGFLLLLILTVYLLIVPSLSAIFAGVLILNLFSKDKTNNIDFRSVAVGVVAMTVLSFIPIIGDITKLILNLVIFGSVARYLHRNFFKIGVVNN